MDVNDRLKKARTELILSNPFFGFILLKQKLVPDPDLKFLPFPTMGTNGKVIYYHPDFVQSISDLELRSALVHEAMHIAMLHPLRRDHREPLKWNLAGDFAINPLIKDSGFPLRDDWAYKEEFRNMNAESIYAKLPESLKIKVMGEGEGEGDKDDNKGGGGQGKGDDHDHTACGGVLEAKGPDGKDLSEAERSQAIAEGKALVAQAATVAKSVGDLPAGVKRLLDEILEPKVDWRQKLRHFVEITSRNDYSWMRPNRRYLSQGFYLPGLFSQEIGTIVIAVDTSGSISQHELAQFFGETTAILEAFDLECVHVVYCDAAVAKVDEYTKADLPLRPEPAGGGGTDFRPPFKWVEKNNIYPTCFIYMTDMYGPFPEEDPGYPTMWLSTSGGEDHFNVPFGEVVDISDIKE